MGDRQFGRIRYVRGDNKGRYPFSHSIYIEGENKRVLIDPACSLDKVKHIRDKEGVDAVWLSHWHEDHFQYLYLFDDDTLWLSQRDFPPLADVEVMLDWCGADSAIFRDYWRHNVQKQFHYYPRQHANFIEDGEIVDCGGVTVEAIATPGHTPGHLSFFFPNEEILFLGDYDLTPFGPWYGDLYSDIDETIASIRRLKSISAKIWLVSHEQGIYEKNPGEIWQHYENVIYERDDKIMDCLQEPQTLEEIAERWIIYGKPREPLIFFEFGERALLKKHLRRLERQNKIIFSGDTYIINK